jgi:hypothetical protein
MKSLIVLVAAAALACGAVTLGQTSQPITPPSNSGYYGYGGYGGGYHSSTAAEGAARGMADVVRSQGEANLNNSAAAVNYSVARSNQIDNRAKWTSTYFQMREENRQARAAERRPRATMADLVRYAQAGKPKPLSPSQLDVVTGAVSWPLALQVDGYAKSRAELEPILAGRASSRTISPADYMKVRQVTNAMLAQLKGQIREIPPEQYTVAKRFLESLAYEATRPLG